MTDFLLPLVPEFGLYIVGLTVFLAAIGVPLPSSVVLLTSGGLAATGDLVLYQLLITTVFAYVVGDQLAFAVGSLAGPGWLESLKKRRRLGGVLKKAESLYDSHGILAVFLSRTVLSPSGPCVAYLSGASKMKHATFTVTALSGTVTWTVVYGLMGYVFTGQVPTISDFVAALLAVSVALLFAVGFGVWLALAWRRFDFPTADTAPSV